MNVQFFNPPVHHYAGIRYKMLPLIGLPTLAAWFNQHGHHAEVVDLEAMEVNPDRFRAAFAAQRDRWPDVIGLTGLSITKRGMHEMITILREVGFTGTIVVGGVYATMKPQDPLDWGADLVITGECEGNVIQLIERGRGASTPGRSRTSPTFPRRIGTTSLRTSPVMRATCGCCCHGPVSACGHAAVPGTASSAATSSWAGDPRATGHRQTSRRT